MVDRFHKLSAEKLAGVYYLCGEPLLRDRAMLAIRRAALGKGDELAGFNLDSFDGQDKSLTAATISAAARTLPMMGEKRLIQVKNAHLLAGDVLKGLLPYLEKPAKESCLLFVADRADTRLKFFALLKKKGGFERFEPLKERQVPSWVQGEARQLGVKLKAGAAERIADAVGTDMGQLSATIEQLGLYVGKGQAVSAEDVEEVLAQTRQRSIFELTNAVGRGDRREAMLVLNRMTRAKEPALRIVAMLARHLRHLWQGKLLQEKKVPPRTIAGKLGIHPFFVNDVLNQSERFSTHLLEQTHRALHRADLMLKSSRLPDALVLDQLVLALCREDAKHAERY